MVDLVKATNHAGYNVEAWAPGAGWCATGDPHTSRTLALIALEAQQKAYPELEFRMYEALTTEAK